MFHERNMRILNKSYFSIVLIGNYDVTLQSKNMERFWYIHSHEFCGGDVCSSFLKHRASHPYYWHGKARDLRQAVRKIKGDYVFWINGRRMYL